MTFEGDDNAVLAPVFFGHRMEAELIRSVLEANDIPSVIFGSGGYTFGSDHVSPDDRVMVRSDQVEAALDVIRTTDLEGGEIVEPTEDDYEVMADADAGDETAGLTFDEDDEDDEEWVDPTQVEIFAESSDWGIRIVGLIGVAALIVAIVVLVTRAG